MLGNLKYHDKSPGHINTFSDIVPCAVLLKGNASHAHYVIAINKCLSSLSSVYVSNILDFRLPELKIGVAKESSITG